MFSCPFPKIIIAKIAKVKVTELGNEKKFYSNRVIQGIACNQIKEKSYKVI